MKSQKKYRYFLFDLDRTLWNFDLNAKRNIFRLIDKYSLPISSKESFYNDYEMINHFLWDQYEKGIITKELLRSERFRQTLLKYILTVLCLQKNRRRVSRTMPNQTALMPYAAEVLAELKRAG